MKMTRTFLGTLPSAVAAASRAARGTRFRVRPVTAPTARAIVSANQTNENDTCAISKFHTRPHAATMPAATPPTTSRCRTPDRRMPNST